MGCLPGLDPVDSSLDELSGVVSTFWGLFERDEDGCGLAVDALSD